MQIAAYYNKIGKGTEKVVSWLCTDIVVHVGGTTYVRKLFFPLVIPRFTFFFLAKRGGKK